MFDGTLSGTKVQNGARGSVSDINNLIYQPKINKTVIYYYFEQN